MFCHVPADQVLGVHNVNSTYHVPLLMRNQGLVSFLSKKLKLDQISLTSADHERGASLLRRWRDMTLDAERRFDDVSIVLVGKYITLQDSYMSVVKALEHASMKCGRKLNLQWVLSLIHI